MSERRSNDATNHLVAFLEMQYATRGVTLHPLASTWKQVYHVQRADGPDWVVRLFPTANEESPTLDVTMQAALLDHLARHAFPAERAIRAADGSTVSRYADHAVLVTTYLGPSLQAWQATLGETDPVHQVAGAAPFDYAPATFQAWGAALGQLHALALDSELIIPITNERPRPQLTWASEYLSSVADQVTPAQQAQYDALTQSLHTIDSCEDLAFTLVHGDCGLSNAILLPSGQVALIDWDWAGLGPPVIDLGWLLSNCFVKATQTINPVAIAAVAAGYSQYRQLTAAELARLTDATQFHTLKLLVVYFVEQLTRGLAEDALIYGATYATWQRQFTASAEIAALAQAEFYKNST